MLEPLLKPANASGLSFFAGFCLIFNNACGAGVTSIPYVFASSGWFVSLLTLAFFWLCSSITSVMLCEAMSAAPSDMQELTGSARYFLGKTSQSVTQAFLFLFLASQQVASVIISAQSLDMGMEDIVGGTCGMGYFSEAPDTLFHCTSRTVHDSPFQKQDLVLSLGMVLAAVFAIPLGMYNLEENVVVQDACMFLTFACAGAWIYVITCCSSVDFTAVPHIGTDFSQLFGTMLYNFAYVVTVPSWCIQRAPGVSVKRTIWLASTLCFVLYIIVGWIGAAAFSDTLSPSVDLLVALNHRELALPADVFFPIMAALSGVPIFAIIMRCNLIEQGVCGPRMATFLGVFLPWIIALCLQNGSGLQRVINLSSILFGAIVNFLIPLACIFVYAGVLHCSKAWRTRFIVLVNFVSVSIVIAISLYMLN